MSIELVLATLEVKSDEARDTAILDRLADLLRTTIRKYGGQDEDVESSASEVLVHLPGGPPRPQSGMLMARFWQLETLASRRFYAYDYSGEGWLDCLRDFARSEDRAIGSIVNFETFVEEGGQRSPVNDCQVRKVDPNEK